MLKAALNPSVKWRRLSSLPAEICADFTDFQENCIELEKADPVVLTMDASQTQSEVKLIGVCMNYGAGGFDQGFLLWESGKEGEKRDIAASVKGAIFKAACSGLIKVQYCIICACENHSRKQEFTVGETP